MVDKALHLGNQSDGRPIYLSPQARRKHVHIIGASDSGKSRFLEYLLRQHLRNSESFILLDWHGRLASNVIQHARRLHVGVLKSDHRKLVLINPSEPTHIVPLNFFSKRADADITVQVRRRLSVTIRSLGDGNKDFLPRFERIGTLLYGYACETGEALPNLIELLSFPNIAMRQAVLDEIHDPYLRCQWEEIVQIKSQRDWTTLTESTANRLNPFLSSKAITRFLGLPNQSIDLFELMNEPSFIVVNLARSGFLDEDSARLFASMFLLEIFEAAIRRANERDQRKAPNLCTLYLDEAQNYMDDTLGCMLDEVRKGGIAINVCHQHLGQIESPRLKESLLTNCGTRIVFKGGSFASASELANEVFLPEINHNEIKHRLWRSTHDYREETRIVRSKTHGQGRSSSQGKGQSRGVSRGITHGISRGLSTGSSVQKSHSIGRSHTEGRSNTVGLAHTEGLNESQSYTYSHAAAETAGMGRGEVVSHVVATPMDGVTQLVDHQIITEGSIQAANTIESRTTTDSQSDSHATGSSEADTYSESQTTSEADSSSHSRNSGHGRSHVRSNGRSFSKSQTRSVSENDFVSSTQSSSATEGESVVPFLRPIKRKEISSVQFYSLEEKRSRFAEEIKRQPQRHAFVQIENEDAKEMLVPFVDDPVFSKKYVKEYMERIYKRQGAIPADEADQLLEESRRRFIARMLKRRIGSVNDTEGGDDDSEYLR